jgi:hypothetical protein
MSSQDDPNALPRYPDATAPRAPQGTPPAAPGPYQPGQGYPPAEPYGPPGQGYPPPGSGHRPNEGPPYREPSGSDDAERNLARKRVEARRALGGHVVAYVVVNAFLIVVWAFTGAGYFWPIWALAGWGIGLVLNAWDVLFRRPITNDDIERELRRGRGGR